MELVIDKKAATVPLPDPGSRVELTMDLDVPAQIQVTYHDGNGGRSYLRRVIAQQLLTLFESRGAPLAPNERGELRTSGGDTVPVLVYQPSVRDSLDAESEVFLMDDGEEAKSLATIEDLCRRFARAEFHGEQHVGGQRAAGFQR